MVKRLVDFSCALLCRRGALPHRIDAISQDRDRGRCDHDPILIEIEEKYICRQGVEVYLDSTALMNTNNK